MPLGCVRQGGLGSRSDLLLLAWNHSPRPKTLLLVMDPEVVDLVESAWVALGEKTVQT